MADINNFTTVDQGWALVRHFVQNELLQARMAIEMGADGWQEEVDGCRQKLYNNLADISARMFATVSIGGHTAARAIREMALVVNQARPSTLQDIKQLKSCLNGIMET